MLWLVERQLGWVIYPWSFLFNSVTNYLSCFEEGVTQSAWFSVFFLTYSCFFTGRKKSWHGKMLAFISHFEKVLFIFPFKDLLNYWQIFVINTHDPAGQGAQYIHILGQYILCACCVLFQTGLWVVWADQGDCILNVCPDQPRRKQKYKAWLAMCSCDLQCAVAMWVCEPILVETCNVRACGAFLGLRSVIATSHIFKQ